jgi:TrmH family RNA methyltransferase
VTLGRSRERLLRRISTRKGREAEGVVLLEGPRVIETALDHGGEVLFGAIEAGARSAGVERALARLTDAGTDVAEIGKADFVELADTDAPQGILAVAREPRVQGPQAPLGIRVLVLDRVQDPGNVGTLVRAAAGLGAERVLALDGTADPWSAKAVRASAGLVFRLPPLALAWPEAAQLIRASGVPLVVADAKGEDVRSWLGRSPASAGFALALGNEAAGPRPELLDVAEATLAVPLARGVESLNVAAAAAVLLWALGPGRDTARDGLA